ncbi:hypothetical protein F5Y14DRAFT_411087 [Nemania sp. NC0429]|nr:hypothetical protein F5Y14DRAFT_411087 [Nemania sp. NC0429]
MDNSSASSVLEVAINMVRRGFTQARQAREQAPNQGLGGAPNQPSQPDFEPLRLQRQDTLQQFGPGNAIYGPGDPIYGPGDPIYGPGDPIFGPGNPIPREPATTACDICGDKYPRGEMFNNRCSHWHCKECLRSNALVALKSSHPFAPAKCCRVFPKESLYKFGALSDAELGQYTLKMEELTNPRSAMYCCGEDCGAFIPLGKRTRRVGECVQCGRKTCRTCRAKSHFGPCDKAKLKATKETDESVHHLAEQKGWKRCPNCYNFIQRDGGCNHMTCHCGQEFCYRCGQVLSSDYHECD